MCGIYYGDAKDAYAKVNLQTSRGLDSIGYYDIDSGLLLGAIEDASTILNYKDFFADSSTEIEGDNKEHMVFVHHRKASIGAINLENNHPFLGKKFMLAQNGTASEWYKKLPADDQYATDSQSLLYWLEKTCDTLEECSNALNEIDEVVGTIIIFKDGEILFWSDSTRGTFIDIVEQDSAINSGKVRFLNKLSNFGISNYYEYANGFSIICNAKTGLIRKEWYFNDEFNKDLYTTMSKCGTKESKKTLRHSPLKKNDKEEKPYTQTQITDTDRYYDGEDKNINKDENKFFNNIFSNDKFNNAIKNISNYGDKNNSVEDIIMISEIRMAMTDFGTGKYTGNEIVFICEVLKSLYVKEEIYMDIYSISDGAFNKGLYNAHDKGKENEYTEDYRCLCSTTLVPIDFYKNIRGINVSYKYKSSKFITAYKYNVRFNLYYYAIIMKEMDIDKKLEEFYNALSYVYYIACNNNYVLINQNKRFSYDLYREMLGYEKRLTGGDFDLDDIDIIPNENEEDVMEGFVLACKVFSIKDEFMKINEFIIKSIHDDYKLNTPLGESK